MLRTRSFYNIEIEFAIFLHFPNYLWWSLTLSTAFGPQPTEHTKTEYTHRRNAISHISSSLPFFGELSKLDIHDNTSYAIPVWEPRARLRPPVLNFRNHLGNLDPCTKRLAFRVRELEQMGMCNERQGLCSRELGCFQSQQKQVLRNDSRADENACARWWIDINPVEQPIDENLQMLSI